VKGIKALSPVHLKTTTGHASQNQLKDDIRGRRKRWRRRRRRRGYYITAKKKGTV